MPDAEAAALQRFLRGELPPECFPHREHVRMAHALLARRPFERALPLYARALRRITARAGCPERFNLTVTVALLALIDAARRAAPQRDFEAFAAAYPELFERAPLARWYRPEQLSCAAARGSFLLPDPPHAQ